MSQETKGVKQGKRKKDMEKEDKEDGDVAFIPTGCYSIDIFISPVKADKLTNKSRQRNTRKTHTHTHSGLIGQIKQKYTN